MTEIPDADSFTHPKKKGFLSKLTGKGWLYSGSWKKRCCVLDGTKFYYFENEKSKGSEKSSGVISLDYYDVCEEYDAKDKKAPHVFIIGTSVRGFFDNRHQFSASSKSDMQDWIRSVHDVITEARNIRSRNGRTRMTSGNSDQSMEDDQNGTTEFNIDEPEQLISTVTKDRVRGPLGRRLPQRKSMMPASSPTEEFMQKQRSLSLSSPNEQNGDKNESENSTNDENRRISLSMDAVDKEDNVEEDVVRSSSNYEISSKKPLEETKKFDSNGIILPKKTLYGKIGSQHAALTKELELKLKSGMAPGGRKMPTQETSNDREGIEFSHEMNDLHKKVDQQDTALNSVQNDLKGLDKKVRELSLIVYKSSDHTQNFTSQVLEVLNETSEALKEVQETHLQCEKVLEELQQTKTEHQELIKECQEYLSIIKDLCAPAPEK